MKKIMLLAAASLISIGSAYASNSFGDGSPENTFVYGAAPHSGLSTTMTGDSRTYTRANGFGGGSVEDKYYIGRHLNSPQSQHGVPAHERAHFGDGSPDNQE